MLYSSIIFVVPIITEKGMHGTSHKRMSCMAIAALLCGLIAAFRGTTGSDSAMYINAFINGPQSISRWEEFEIGFVIVVNVLNTLGATYHWFFFLMEFLTSLFVFLAVAEERNLIDTKLAVFIYMTDLYFFGFNGLRQAVAVGIGLYAMVLYFNEKRVGSFLWILFAACFHRSALICILAYALKLICKNRYRKMIMWLIFGVALILVANRQLLGEIVYILTGSGYYRGYLTRTAPVDTTVFKYYLKLAPLLLVVFANIKNYEKGNEFFVYFVLMVVGLIISSLGAITQTQVARLGMYFSYMKILVCGFCVAQKIPIRMNCMSGKIFVRGLLYIFFYGMFFYSYFIRGFSMLVPYGLFK